MSTLLVLSQDQLPSTRFILPIAATLIICPFKQIFIYVRACYRVTYLKNRSNIYSLVYCPYLLQCVKIGNTIKYSKNTIWGILRDAQKNTQKILPGRANSPKKYSKNTPRSIFWVLFGELALPGSIFWVCFWASLRIPQIVFLEHVHKTLFLHSVADMASISINII